MKKSIIALHRKLQNRRREKAKEEFYYSHLYAQQSYQSRVLQFYLSRLFVLIASFIAFLYVTAGERLYGSLLAAISVLVLYHLIAKASQSRMINGIVKKIRGDLAQEEFWKRIKSYDRDGFIGFVERTLQKLPQYSQVKITPNLFTEGINILAKKEGQWIAIQCHILDDEDLVEARYARELSRAMSMKGYTEGIIISTTDFRQATSSFIELIKEKRQIKLINKQQFFKMAKEAEQLPQEQEINDLMLKKIEYNQINWRETQSMILARPRVVPYFIYGTLLILLTFFWDVGIPFLYYGSASVLYTLGLISLIRSVGLKSIPISWKK